MDDSEILDLYFARSEQAIAETDRKYGAYCFHIANHFYSGYIGSIVGMKDGLTDEGKSYHLTLCEDNVFIHWPTEANGRDEYWYHIFRFANNGDPVFSNPKEQSIVRLKKDADGSWWRTSSTGHYAEFDTRITEEEAQSILNSYAPVQLETHPLSEFREQ